MANSKKGTAQIKPVTPKQQVVKQFGTKTALVEAIIALYDAPDGSKGKLQQGSNTKLMSHLHNTKRMVAKFGNRSSAVAAVLKLKYPKGETPQSEQTKFAAFSPWRLMDLHRQLSGETK